MAAAPVEEVMQVKRLREEAVLPVRGSVHAAGFDLAAAEAAVVPAGGKAMVKTGLSIAIPTGTYARIAPRSGLAVKKFINVGAGVVDFDYRGEVCVVLFNHGAEDFSVGAGDRVAQLILEKVAMVDCVEVEELTQTTRGAGGFGSTGIAEAVAQSPRPGQKRKDVGLSPSKCLVVNDGSQEVADLREEVKALRAALMDVDLPGLRAEVARLQAQVGEP